MARRVTRAGRRAPAATEAPAARRRCLRLPAWAFVLTVFCCLAGLSGHFGGHSSSPPMAASVASATSTSAGSAAAPEAPVAPATGASAADSAVYAMPMRPIANTDGGSDPCTGGPEMRDYLPIDRWTTFDLSVIDNATVPLNAIVSTIAGFMFTAASWIWQLLALFLGFGFSFDMMCSVASPINEAGGMIAEYAAWFLIPAWLVVLAAAARRWGRNPSGALRLVASFLVASGMIFFLADQSSQHQKDPLAAYTAPWMAAEVQKWFAEASTSLISLDDLKTVASSQKGDAFYDQDAGAATCAGLDAELYTEYHDHNQDSGIKDGIGAMEQISKIWEVSFVRSWESAQFGIGTIDYPSPAHAACRMLEGRSGVAPPLKWQAYDASAGFAAKTSDSTYRGFWISPTSGYQPDEVIAWGACQQTSAGSAAGDIIPEWKSVKNYSGGNQGDGSNVTDWWSNVWNNVGSWVQKGTNTAPTYKSLHDACNDVLLSSSTNFSVSTTPAGNDTGPLNSFYFKGNAQLNAQVGPCMKSDSGCPYVWSFVNSWLGGNGADRVTNGLMALAVAIVFLLVLGPMSLGLMIISGALAALVMLLGFALLLVAVGNENGKRMLKLTGAAAAGKFIFTLALTFLMMFIAITYTAIGSLIDDPAPNFAEQALQVAAPLVALFIFKKVAKVLGLGDIGTLSGALGFAGTAAAHAAGEARLAEDVRRSASAAVSGTAARFRKPRHSSFQEETLAGRRVGGDPASARSAARRRSEQLKTLGGSGARTGAKGVVAGTGRTARQRSSAYSAMLKAVGGSTGQAAVAGRGPAGQVAVAGRGPAGQVPAAPGALAGGGRARRVAQMPLSGDAGTARHDALQWRRSVSKVSDVTERRRIQRVHTEEQLDALRQRQWGAGHPGGRDTAFAGFADEADRLRALSAMAAATGLPQDRILLGGHGLAVPTPVMADQDGRRRFTSVTDGAHPVHYLDAATVQRQTVNGVRETDAQYIARIVARLEESGYVHDGRFVDVFAAHGLDRNDPKVKARIEAWMDGAQDEELSAISIVPRYHGRVIDQAAHAWSDQHVHPGHGPRERDPAQVRALVGDARQEIGDIGRIDVGGIQAREVRALLEQELEEMRNVVEQRHDLRRRRDQVEPRAFVERSSELAAWQSAVAGNIDELCDRLGDVFHVSAKARALCDALGDDHAGAGRVAQRAKEADAATDTQDQAWGDLLQKYLGGIYDEDASGDDVHQLKKLIDERFDAEESSNEKVLRRIEEAEARDEQRGSDPRSPEKDADVRPVNMRDFLKRMFGPTSPPADSSPSQRPAARV